ncbi:hypothetical protein DBV15_12476 [Temnothorax longispinosus]|uniref:18S rRNA (guanine(1575)-N(7))-methyltransferase Bud23 C-terminal domain-containing protein n=1 Tax=Temnothorax longispinosus TaxID=300112 RepID=A0A4S2KSY0_9HYME|nr:hypothetical protein DBV15_12476 [Temnothorax longispinosus]
MVLVLMTGGAAPLPKALGVENEDRQTVANSRREYIKKAKGKSLKKSRDWILEKKERRMSKRATEVLVLPEDQSCLLLNIGCGSGLTSGSILEDQGHVWIGVDISSAMLGPHDILGYVRIRTLGNTGLNADVSDRRRAQLEFPSLPQRPTTKRPATITDSKLLTGSNRLKVPTKERKIDHPRNIETESDKQDPKSRVTRKSSISLIDSHDDTPSEEVEEYMMWT